MTAQSLLGGNSCHVWAANAEGKYLDLNYESNKQLGFLNTLHHKIMHYLVQ